MATFTAPEPSEATTLIFRFSLPPSSQYRDLAVLVLPANGVLSAIDALITIDELVSAVNVALEGCLPDVNVTPTATPTPVQ